MAFATAVVYTAATQDRVLTALNKLSPFDEWSPRVSPAGLFEFRYQNEADWIEGSGPVPHFEVEVRETPRGTLLAANMEVQHGGPLPDSGMEHLLVRLMEQLGLEPISHGGVDL